MKERITAIAQSFEVDASERGNMSGSMHNTLTDE